MAAAGLSPSQLRQQVDDIAALAPGALAIGLRTSGRWEGPETLDHAGRVHRIVYAPSVLMVREALAEAEETGVPVIVLTPLDSRQVGRDVLGRLARGRLYTPDLWQAVLGLFKARRADPALREGCLAQALLDYAPPDGYPPVPTGVLDEATAWRALDRHAFGVERRDPDLPEWLRWAATETGALAYGRVPPDLRRLFRARLIHAEDPAVASVVAMLDSGAGPDAIALAIACGVAFPEPNAPSPLPDAAARLERYHGDAAIDPRVGARLAEAAATVIADLRRAERHPEANRQVARADQILAKIHALGDAHRSRLSPSGYSRRLERLGQALRDALTQPAPECVLRCEDRLRAVLEHDQAGREPARTEAARMAVRLVRWPVLHAAGGDQPPSPFARLAASYRDDGSFVDRAREAIAAGDPLPALSDVYRAIEEAVALRRDAQDRAFAAALAEWSTAGTDGDEVLPIEQVLARVVAPIAKGTAGPPVLLIVLDGLSWPIAHGLFEALREGRWHEVTPAADGRSLPPVAAALPTITEVSRASLLAGRICRGNSGQEKRWFAEHPALRAACRPSAPPVLFHKAEIDEGGRGRLDPEVRAAIDSDALRVVAVVVNAIDDHLAGPSQVETPWTPERIRPLPALLEAAHRARRIVAVASDHGHVLHREGSYRPYPGAGARWRPDSGAVQADEVRVAGPRVIGPGDSDRVVLPWRATTRYALPRNGYHGGASPQEVLAPFALFAPVPEPAKGLGPSRTILPPWWLEIPPPEPSPTATPGSSPPEEDYRGMVLFQAASARRANGSGPASPAPTGAPAAAVWIGRLVTSELFRRQRQAASRLAPDDDRVATALRELDRRGGTMTPAAFAARVGIPAQRLAGFVAHLQRLLNVDGYPVLHLDRDRDAVVLDVPLLVRQFELE